MSTPICQNFFKTINKYFPWMVTHMINKTRLALDVGTNSIGWALFQLDKNNQPASILKCGSRIFSDGRNPKDKTSLAVSRRLARQMRRQRDRKLQRKYRVINQLIRMSLFPKNQTEQNSLKDLDVLALRASAIDSKTKLSSFELGRVLLHLSKQRGFKSSRKEAANTKDTKLTEPMENVKKILSENQAKSYGDFLYQRYLKGLTTVATIQNGFYPSRDIIEKEYDDIILAQSKNHPHLNSEDWAKLRSYIFHQRPLKPVEVGRCGLYEDKKRTFQYMPSFEYYRLLQNLHNLRWRDSNFKEYGLDPEYIYKALQTLRHKKKIKYSDIKKAASLNEVIFTIERKLGKGEIPGCPTHAFMGDPKKGILNDIWHDLNLSQQDQVAHLFFEASDEALENQLKELKFLNTGHIQKLVDAKIPSYSDVTCAFSSEALQTIVHHSLNDGESPTSVLYKIRKEEERNEQSDLLEYYGKAIPDSVVPLPQSLRENSNSLNEDERLYGKIANPTVHIALGQIRHVVNEIIHLFGKPEEIHLEFARELKLSKKQKDEISKINKKNEEINSKAKAFIAEYGLTPTAFHMERVKLWFEMESKLDCKCAYTGMQISANMVLTEKVEVDHIIPFSRSLDDSMANKVLVVAAANREKKNKTPFEAFGHDPVRWSEILKRAEKLPENKTWRFSENALERFKAQGGFLARQLTDTSYLAKVTKKYLGTLIPDNKIVTSPGRITALARRHLGLNAIISKDQIKNRNDHRHHAVDALVIGLTDRSFLNKAAQASANEQEIIEFPKPWKIFRTDAQNAIENIVVSHRVDHGENAQFVEETGFGVPKHLSPFHLENNFKLVTTKGIDDVRDINKIVSPYWKELAEKKGLEFLKTKGVKKLRIYDVCKESPEDIGGDKSYIAKIVHGKNQEHHVHYKKDGTFRMFLWKIPVAKTAKNPEGYQIKATYLYYYDVKKYKANPEIVKPHPAAKLVMTLNNGDSVAVERNGKLGYYLIKSLRPVSTQTEFIEIQKSSREEDEKAFLLAASRLKENKVRKIRITPAGQVLDHGPVL